jgi:hypothetical protein
MPRKRNSLLALAFKPNKYWNGHGSDAWTPYKLHIDGEYLIKYYPTLNEIEKIPIKPITLENLGLIRLPSGRITPR